MKKIFIIAGLLFFITSGQAMAGGKNPQSCQQFITKANDHMLEIFHDGKATEQQKRQNLADLFHQSVDTDWIGKYILGPSWKKASTDEQNEYLRTYREYVTNTYVSKYSSKDGAIITNIEISSITPTPQKPNEFMAKTVIKIKNDDDVSVDYLLAQSDNKCQIHDIKIEGISLLLNHRSEFQAVADFSGIKGVMKSMQKQFELAGISGK